MRNLLLVLLIALGWQQTAAATPAPADPYNDYIWNASNVRAGDGEIDTGDWFEWWYFKVVDPTTQTAFYFTYGIVNPWDTKGTEAGTGAALQFGDFADGILLGQKFPIEQFTASYTSTDVMVGTNHATDKHIDGHITDNGHDVSWDLSVERVWQFDAMSWAMGSSSLSNIYWYPAQASATMTGWIQVDGVKHTFTSAPAYQDRNWGRSFPKWWTWLTSNTFDNSPGTVLAVGGGEPQVLDTVYTAGLCIGLFYNGQQYAFRTIDGDKLTFNIQWGTWQIEAENGSFQKIVINAYAPPAKFLDLPFDSPEGALFHDYEALLGGMTVSLYTWSLEKLDWVLVTTLTSETAGIEWGSPIPVTLSTHNFSRTYNRL